MIQKLLEIRKRFYEKNELLFSLQTEKYFKGLKSNEIHCIYFIEAIEKPNITNIAREMDITTSGMTKITTRLIKKGYLEKYKLEDNNQKVYFSLTEKGKEIYYIHEEIHEKEFMRNYKFLNTFSKEELEIVLSFYEKNTKFLVEEIKKYE